MKNRLIALLLAALLVFCMAACSAQHAADLKSPENQEHSSSSGEQSSESAKTGTQSDSEHIDFSLTSYYSFFMTSAGYDPADDPVVQWVQNKFNVTVDSYACDWATANDQVRVWVNGGTMPNFMTWPDISVAELKEYADQGLIQPLPENWESRCPNLAKMVNITGYSDLVKFDGLTYAIPHATYGNFNAISVPALNVGLYLRKDWAEQVGLDTLGANGCVSMAELKAYLEKVEAAGLCKYPSLGGSTKNLVSAFLLSNGINNQDFIDTGTGFIWSPQQEGYAAAIQEFQDWYNAGLITPDFYTEDQLIGFNKFKEGIMAAAFNSANVGEVQTTIEALMAVDGLSEIDMKDPEKRAPYYDKVLFVTLEGDDGTVYSEGTYNYWLMSSFSPETDRLTMERILDMLDWMSTMEGQASERMGIPGVDFTVDANGVITVLNEKISSGEYTVSPSRFFNVWAYCGDDVAFAEGIVGRYKADQDIVKRNVKLKCDGTVFEPSDTVTALDSESKKNYSVDIPSAMAEIVVSGTDVDNGIADFIERNKGLWQPVIDDLSVK